MRKILFSGLMGIILFSFNLNGLQARENYVLKVKVQTANVRAEPDANSAIIQQVKQGTLLESNQKIDNWFEIVVTDEKGNNISGYIHANVVDVISGEAKEEKEVSPPEVKKEPAKEAPTPAPAPAPVQVPVSEPSKSFSSSGVKVMGGLSLASMTYSFEDSEELNKYKKTKLGFQGGLGFEIGGRIALEVDFLYIQKGVIFKGSEPDGNFDLKFFTDELCLPVLMKFNFLPGSTPFILAGGEIGYVYDNKVKYHVEIPSIPLDESGTEDLKEDTNRIDYGLVLGGGFELATGAVNLVIEGRYHLGLSNLSKEEGIDKINSNAILLIAGFKF